MDCVHEMTKDTFGCVRVSSSSSCSSFLHAVLTCLEDFFDTTKIMTPKSYLEGRVDINHVVACDGHAKKLKLIANSRNVWSP